MMPNRMLASASTITYSATALPSSVASAPPVPAPRGARGSETYLLNARLPMVEQLLSEYYRTGGAE